ncbi:unnamed protein product [Brachionus calyciflorus]|uniref:Uncharacterized protein n=1 Tax=Brachionus calyciflorus TaxID=104777 RepID=A0A814G1U9_9BILA|nr:unnamed protein product [Brachionus calyciflorus]
MDEYKINEKITHIITDNADEALNELTSSDDTLMDISERESSSTDSNVMNLAVNENLFNSIANSSERLSCVAHTLQLVIKDGLSDTHNVTRAFELVARAINSIN